MEKKNAWLKYSEEELRKVNDFAEEYRAFISNNKTERECVKSGVAMLEAAGFSNLADAIKKNRKLKAGDKVYAVHMGKQLLAFIIGRQPLENGMNILGAHIDSPRIDVKQNPVYEEKELAYFDTHYYGGIKKYQWVTLPMAIHGVIAKKDGTVVDVVIGEDDDTVVGISDILIHLAGKQMAKNASVAVEGENLDVLVAGRPLAQNDDEEKKEEKNAVKKALLKILKDRYDVEEEDLLSAELEVVPSGKARNFGLDSSMIMGYGHDDRCCAYPSLVALIEAGAQEKTGVCMLVDKEEVGSIGATGMKSRFFENTVAELISLTTDSYSDLLLRRALQNSCMLSSDVSAAFDPLYAASFESKNAAYLSHGLVFNKFTGARGKSGSNDANAEYMALIRRTMDEADVSYHTAELGKVDEGGGGTIAYIMARYGMQVIDSGLAVLNMHAPWEIISKADLYESKKGYMAFLKI